MNNKIMKKIVGLVGLLLLGGGYFYSQQSKSEINNGSEITIVSDAKDEEYKASIPGWTVGIDKAFAESKRTGKPIMANFTGSDWCGWCHRLKKSVYDTQEFKTWAAKNVVLFEADFPKKLKVPEKIALENNALQRQLGVQGFPTVWMLNTKEVDGAFTVEALGSLGYESSAAAFIKKADKILEKIK